MIRDVKIYLEIQSGVIVVSASVTFTDSDAALAYYHQAVALVEEHRALKETAPASGE